MLRYAVLCTYGWPLLSRSQGIHLITMNTPNGQAVQILLEELKDVYGTEWTTTLINIMTNEQKKEWFLRLDPNGRQHSSTVNPCHVLTSR